ncbi:hypothetical protein NBO_45g0004 [Nosema bombycis CQ1]|uniref:Telomeric single stranded DNA binding POT1/Cdc13 domain-containing protein n=1 Tax=Nosema bombycis (strain CQ1 / CVCC 102059) TaxID=578461 RepID=R0KT62_NOSB1|nr:hypothetical protein NBO_45g0004 [Nosema bombycis CQ1]|eukprot:EOB13981.1 hypothetical protein NBO_45g0004 [Nosema bombycis CQ1]
MTTGNPRDFMPLDLVKTTKISEIYDGQTHNIYCKVICIHNWILSKGGDYVMTITVTDYSVERIFLKIFSAIRLKFTFKENDILYVRNVKLYKKDLFIIQQPFSFDIVNKTLDRRNTNREFYEIKDIGTKKYIDTAGLVIHKQRETNNIVIINLIDFTKNPRINGSLNRGQYTSDMILHVKLWDKHANNYDEIHIGSFFKLENLNVKIQDNVIYGNLSDQDGCRIYNLFDFNIINKIKQRREEYEKYSLQLYKDIIFTFNKINKRGYFRAEFEVIKHFPLYGKKIIICQECKHIFTGEEEDCVCIESSKVNMLALKLLAKDKSGDATILCKNEIAVQALNKLEKNERYWKCLMYADKQEDIVFVIKDFL